jgi:hydrogenase/urease accessory protein HupE
MIRLWLTIGVVILVGTPARGLAHGIAAAFVGIETVDGHEADVLVKLPEVEGETLDLTLGFAEGCRELTAPTRVKRKAGTIERWSVRCESPLRGMEIEVLGLNAILGEAFIELRSPDDGEWNTIVRRGQSTTRLGAEAERGLEHAAGYFSLGVEHILSGLDHLFFVLALMLLVWRTRSPNGARAVAKTMLATITAFTVGHSLTLAAATLGLVRLSLGPTEVVIALSVLLLAVELARDDRSTLTMRVPWVVAFAFGLLHGFGFAGALAEIGLPPDAIAVPLLLFNLGVEAGQLVIVVAAGSAMFLAASIGRRYQPAFGWASRFETALIYGIGSLTAYWCFERSLGWLLG